MPKDRDIGMPTRALGSSTTDQNYSSHSSSNSQSMQRLFRDFNECRCGALHRGQCGISPFGLPLWALPRFSCAVGAVGAASRLSLPSSIISSASAIRFNWCSILIVIEPPVKTIFTFFMRFGVRTFSTFNPNTPTLFRVCKLEGMVPIETGHSSSPFVLIRWHFQHTHLPSAIHDGWSNTPDLCHSKHITHIMLHHSNIARMGRRYCRCFLGCISRLLSCF